MSSQKILPENQNTYEYHVDQNDTSITITFQIPPETKPEDFLVKLEQDENQEDVLCVEVSNEIPFLAGTLYNKVDPVVTTQNEDNKFIITLNKQTNGEWPYLISKKHTVRDVIDPKSSYLLYIASEKAENEEDKKTGLNYLLYASSAGYTRAIRVYAGVLFESDDRENAINVLQTACDEYNDPDALFQLGNIFVYSSANKQKGYEYLKRASLLGNQSANTTLGRLLSPLSNLEFDKKNVEEAVQYLEKACTVEKPDAIALHELAKLVYTGLGIKRNVQHALELQALAKELNHDVPNLESSKLNEVGTSKGISNKAILAASVVIATSVGIGLLYSFLRRRKH